MKTLDDVVAFFRCLEMEGLVFHPDTDFNDYVEIGTGKPTYTPAQAKVRNELLNRCFEICSDEEFDIYELGIAVFYPEMLKAAA